MPLQVRFTADGNFLLSGARQDAHLLCWDLRGGEAGELYRMERDTGSTSQRIQFDVEPCGRHVVTGGSGGCVRVGVETMHACGRAGLRPSDGAVLVARWSVWVRPCSEAERCGSL